ncbi:MAG: MotA/TolQ/ExbB proton channel family protein [Deltaproteobacteria bacterium]|nr:MotA/TolQ/ExbB proton channel family protein [Deltaproteobacteria bacterium]
MEVTDFSLGGIWEKMGAFATLIVYILAFMSFVSIGLGIERAIVFLRGRSDSLKALKDIEPFLAVRDFEGAVARLKGDKQGYLGRVLQSGIVAYLAKRHEHEDVAYESVTRAVERQTQRELLVLKRGLTTVASVSSLAPFVGLLGTTVGIVNSFTEMAEKGSGGLAVVSAGVAEALVTTAFGLLVAIPALAIFNYLQGWVDARGVDMAETANELLDIVASELKLEEKKRAGGAHGVPSAISAPATSGT